ncbi:CBS domain-containing protein [Candidatus Bathyarchaeota archaeon]|nr:CBS domain-containing protein [Candidatus Bathyarchaeota archaeon]
MGINRTVSFLGRAFIPKVKDLIVKEFVTLDRDKSLGQAFDLMMKDGIHFVIIVSGGNPVGILTRRDLISRYCFKERTDAEKIAVGEVMSHPLITVSPQESVLTAYELMEQKGIRRLTVLEDGKLVGDIRLEDIRHLASDTPITAFYRIGYFLMGMLVTSIIFVVILSL